MPKIGITSSDPYDARGAIGRDVLPYVRAVEAAGGEPVLLRNDPASAASALAALDGVVLSGGVDVDPARYGGRAAHANATPARYRAERDAFEIGLARAARDGAVPTLCICRGLQVANVAFGGTLIEDVREELGERYTIEHRQVHESGLDRSESAPHHDVRVVAGGKFAALLGSAAAFPANSMHHQALRAMGDGLVVAGRTDDGIVEAVEASFAHPFWFGVQWHPEELADDAVSARLFGGLVRAAAATRARDLV